MKAFLAFLARLFGRKPPVPGVPPKLPNPLPTTPGKAAAWLAIAITFVAGWEGLYTKAYRDPIGVVTICYGITNHDRPVRMGDTYTAAECKQMLGDDLMKYMAQTRKCIPKIDTFPPNRQAALVSFTYNVGQGNLCKSSVARHLNAGRVKQGCDALLLYNKAGGRVLRGLTNRRAAEHKLCLLP
jgi:lysozyme